MMNYFNLTMTANTSLKTRTSKTVLRQNLWKSYLSDIIVLNNSPCLLCTLVCIKLELHTTT